MRRGFPRTGPDRATGSVAAARGSGGRDLLLPAATLQGLEAAENFPVALRFLPGGLHRDLRVVYAFARGVDELGDAAHLSADDRTARLLQVDRQLARVWSGGALTDPVLSALRETVRRRGLPPEPFHRLVQANLQDQQVSRYATFEDLLGYCRLSADPVGRIVLGVFGQDDPANVVLSDRVCTALQLLEHWQDVGEDRRAGRVYLPQEDLTAYGVVESDLDVATASPALAGLMRFEIERAARMLEEGAGLVGRLRGWARPCVAGFVAGGRATAAALRATGGDVLARPSSPSRTGTAVRMLPLLLARGDVTARGRNR